MAQPTGGGIQYVEAKTAATNSHKLECGTPRLHAVIAQDVANAEIGGSGGALPRNPDTDELAAKNKNGTGNAPSGVCILH